MSAFWSRLLEPPISIGLAVLAFGLVPWLAVRGWRLQRRSTSNPGHPSQTRWMIRGIRDWILCGALISFGCGLWLGSAPFLWFGVVFLGEEIVETGIMLLALRRSERSQ